jgi:hypothetical protein
MELTDRERRILAELEQQLSTGKPESAARRTSRPRWTVVPAAVLGIVLLVAGVVLGVGDAVLVGGLLTLWWLLPLVRKVLRGAGNLILESLENAPRDAAR